MQAVLQALPPVTFNLAGPTRAAIDRAMAQVKEDILRLYQSCMATWDHKAAFQAREDRGQDYVITIWTSDPIFIYGDLGTRRHPIAAKYARMLRFQEHYQAKTTPGVIGSVSGGASGATIFRKYVMHPGTKARGFSKAIVAYLSPRYAPAIQVQILGAMQQTK